MVVVSSPIFAITERSEGGLYEVSMFLSLLGFGIGMLFARFHYVKDDVVQLVRYTSPIGPMCFTFLISTSSCPVDLLFWMWCIAYWARVVVRFIVVVCSLRVPIYVLVCDLCIIFDCVGE